METELVSDIPLDVSFWGLVMQADMVVKVVMLILLVASVWSWSIIFDKVICYLTDGTSTHKYNNIVLVCFPINYFIYIFFPNIN